MGKLITSLSVMENVCLVSINNMEGSGLNASSAVLKEFYEKGINIDMIGQVYYAKKNSCSMSFTISNEQLAQAMTAIGNIRKEILGLEIEIGTGNTKICVYGDEMQAGPGAASRLIDILKETGAEVRLITTSLTDISVLIPEMYQDACGEAIKKAFDL